MLEEAVSVLGVGRKHCLIDANAMNKGAPLS